MERWWSPPVSSDICVVLSGARASDVRCYLGCESRKLTQKVVQVGGRELDDDAIDPSFAIPLDFLEDRVGLTMQGGIRVAVGNAASEARQHAHRHLEFLSVAQ